MSKRRPKKHKPFKKFYKRPTEDYVAKTPCSHCGNEVNPIDFRNQRAIEEYEIRGLCQLCQDKILNLGD